MDYTLLIAAFFTLFVVIDPIGLAPIYVAVTRGVDPKTRFRIAVRACLTAVGILTIFGFAGEALLDFVGISMPAFRISGAYCSSQQRSTCCLRNAPKDAKRKAKPR